VLWSRSTVDVHDDEDWIGYIIYWINITKQNTFYTKGEFTKKTFKNCFKIWIGYDVKGREREKRELSDA
jgi:hypothetical protein